ncbi:MAG: hypothetical protein R2860_10830 [Desulfobacterales bacterium]
MTTSSPQKPERILLTGPTGFIGKRLLYVLDARGFQVRCLVRPGETLDLSVPLNHPWKSCMRTCWNRTPCRRLWMAWMLPTTWCIPWAAAASARPWRLKKKTEKAAKNFREAAEQAGLRRIIYLGGLGDETDRLSHHLVLAAMKWPAFFNLEK